MTSVRLDPEVVREWLQNSCAAQGVPVVIRDHAVIAQVATLLGLTDTRQAHTPVKRLAATAARTPVIAQKTSACQADSAQPRQQRGRLDQAS